MASRDPAEGLVIPWSDPHETLARPWAGPHESITGVMDSLIANCIANTSASLFEARKRITTEKHHEVAHPSTTTQTSGLFCTVDD